MKKELPCLRRKFLSRNEPVSVHMCKKLLCVERITTKNLVKQSLEFIEGWLMFTVSVKNSQSQNSHQIEHSEGYYLSCGAKLALDQRLSWPCLAKIESRLGGIKLIVGNFITFQNKTQNYLKKCKNKQTNKIPAPNNVKFRSSGIVMHRTVPSKRYTEVLNAISVHVTLFGNRVLGIIKLKMRSLKQALM